MITLLIVVVLVVLLIGAAPTWGYSAGWGYLGIGPIGLILIIVLVLWVTGRV